MNSRRFAKTEEKIFTSYPLYAIKELDGKDIWYTFIYSMTSKSETERMEFIPNNTTWHRRIQYPFKGKIDYKDFTNLSVRVIVTEVDKI